MIPAGFIQDLLARTDVAGVVGRHVELKKSGANLMGLCPFHAEKSPSFSVSPVKQFYHCFGCGASGDAIRFLTEHTGSSFVEAVRELADAAGLQVPEEEVSADERVRRDRLRERRLSMTELLAKAAAHYRGQLRSSPQAISYLKGRGVSGTVAAQYGLGWAAAGSHALAGVFARYDDPLLEEAGLVRRREGSDDGDADARYDWFRERVMFPIRSVAGDVIGFGGRVLGDAKPKYMNSPETPLFSKGRELYGLHEARAALRERGHALVVEGYMDVVALAQHGFGNAVATLGTACTAEHVQKLFRFTDTVVFAFDGDAAGRRAAARALEASLPQLSDLRSVKFLFLPPEHDPDSYVRTLGADAFERVLAAAVPLSQQLVVQAGDGADLGSAEGRARFLAQARPLWSALPDGALRAQLLAELARQAQLGVAELAALWSGDAGTRRVAPASAPSLPRPRQPARNGRRAPAASADLALRLLLRHNDWWERLPAADRQLLHELGGSHGDAVAWLERQIAEHGPQSYGHLRAALAGEPLEAAVTAWVEGAAIDADSGYADLERVLHRLWIAHHRDVLDVLIADGRTDREQLDRIAACQRRIDSHRAAEAAAQAAAAT